MSPPRVWPLLVALAILPAPLPASPAGPSGPAPPWPHPRRASWRGGPNVAARRHRDQRPPRGHGQHGPSIAGDMQALNRAGGPTAALGAGGHGGVRMEPWNQHHHQQQQHNQQQQHHHNNQQRLLKLAGGVAQHSRHAATGGAKAAVAAAAVAATVVKGPPSGKATEREPREQREPEGEWLSAQLGSLARSLHGCSSGAAERGADSMKLRFLAGGGGGREATCNDGSPAGYYIRKSEGSRRWLIFLEGGWYCHSRESCDGRFASLHHLMSSTEWPPTRTGSGILSARPEENPHWWNANTVFVPYCSSDVWSGNAPRSSRGAYAFLGARIVREVVRELVRDGMEHARTVMLAGSSAGGTGVLLHLDGLAAQLRALGVTAQVRGLADSGWFVERRGGPACGAGGPRAGGDCGAGGPAHSMQHAVRFWNGSVPERCRLHLPPGEEWKCYFGFITFQTLATPVFVAQWLFDEAQLTADNVQLLGPARGSDQLPYLRELGQELRATLHPLPAVFSPACLAHTLITSSGWADVQVKGLTLPRALQCWEQSLQHAASRNATQPQQPPPPPGPPGGPAERPPPAVGGASEGGTGSGGGGGGASPAERRWAASSTAGAPVPCAFRAIDSCPWPHCNPSCPALRDALTGQEVSAIAFLTQLGFDVRSMASQLGMDPDTLLNVLSDGT